MMKHRLFSSLFTAMVGALAFTSCNSEIVDNTSVVGKKQMTFTASYDKTINSRTSLGSDLSVLWATDDAISVFDATDNNAFEISKGIGASTAEFNGTASEASAYYAVYPYQSSATISGNVISSVVIPAEQKAIANTFDPKANIMTAVSNSANNLAFKNVCSYAKITTTTPCKKIIFTAGDDDKIAGTFNMTVGADGIASATATSGVNAVTLVPSSGDSFAAGTYYIAINAGTISNLSIACIGVENILSNMIPTSIDVFNRGSVIDLGTVSVENNWEGLCPDENHPHYVDLGLPSGIKWACMNVGATSPVENGNYFVWAGVTPMEGVAYDWIDVPYQTADVHDEPNRTPGYRTKWTKYVGSTTSSKKDPYATDEDALKRVLDPEDDAAHVNWGGNWRMPTYSEWNELLSLTRKWIDNYKGTGVSGYIFYKKKSASSAEYSLSDTHIFVPAAGFCREGEILSVGVLGYYWTSTLEIAGKSIDEVQYARGFDFAKAYIYPHWAPRKSADCVRAVCP